MAAGPANTPIALFRHDQKKAARRQTGGFHQLLEILSGGKVSAQFPTLWQVQTACKPATSRCMFTAKFAEPLLAASVNGPLLPPLNVHPYALP